MSVMMEEHTSFYPVCTYNQGMCNSSIDDTIVGETGAEAASSVAGGTRYIHNFIPPQSTACYYACAEIYKGVGGQTMSVVEEEQHFHPAFSQQSPQQHLHLQQAHPVLGHASGPSVYAIRERLSCLHQHQHSNIPRASLLEPRSSQSAHMTSQSAHVTSQSGGDHAVTPTPAHVIFACTKARADLEQHTLPTVHTPGETPPGHNQNADHTPTSANVASAETESSQQQQQQPLPYPWMKTTKSHAHQWKAHWPGEVIIFLTSRPTLQHTV